MGGERKEYPMTDLIGPLAEIETYIPVVDGFRVPYLKVICLGGKLAVARERARRAALPAPPEGGTR